MKTIKSSALCRPNCEIMTIVVGVPVRPPQRQYLKTCVHWKSLSKHIDNFSNTFIGLMYWFWRLFKTLEHAVEKENMLGKMETCVFVFYTNDILRKLMFLYMYMIHVYIYTYIHIRWCPQWSLVLLTNWGRDKMATISQTTFWPGFSWTKIYEFRITFHRNLFLGIKLTIFPYWFR